ncbi:MAG: DUF2004 domain-containing protein [Candidatus Thiodiazotropha endolucinida]
MKTKQEELEKRKITALSAIKSVYGTDADEYGATLFVSHHLEEIEQAFWKKHLGTTQPEPRSVLDMLILKSHWSDEDDEGIDTFDFTLPEDVTIYVISVSFDAVGEVEDISMES